MWKSSRSKVKSPSRALPASSCTLRRGLVMLRVMAKATIMPKSTAKAMAIVMTSIVVPRLLTVSPAIPTVASVAACCIFSATPATSIPALSRLSPSSSSAFQAASILSIEAL